MREEEQIKIGGSAAVLGFDDGDGTQEFLRRTKYKSKIDQVIDFYGVPYCYKNDIKQFLRYRVEPRHYPVVHEHFYHVLKSTGYSVDEFDYGKMQEEYNAKNEGVSPGLDIKINLQEFSTKQEASQKPVDLSIIEQMRSMLDEIKELKEQVLSTKRNHDGENINTARESEASETTQTKTKKSGTKGGTRKSGTTGSGATS